jgi:hypothetical protein
MLDDFGRNNSVKLIFAGEQDRWIIVDTETIERNAWVRRLRNKHTIRVVFNANCIEAVIGELPAEGSVSGAYIEYTPNPMTPQN